MRARLQRDVQGCVECVALGWEVGLPSNTKVDSADVVLRPAGGVG